MPVPSTWRWASSSILATILVAAAASFTIRPSLPSSDRIAESVKSHKFAARRLHSSTVDGGNESSNSNPGSGRRSRRRQRLPEKNLYEVLGADPAMSRQEIKRLYIALARETHPDAYPNNPAARVSAGAAAGAGLEVGAVADRFNEISQAWTVLSDPKSRRAYDRELAAQKIRDDVVRKAADAAREYGPAARRFYEDFAIPLLRRTTATTLAGWSAVAEVTSEVASEREQRNGSVPNGSKIMKNGKILMGATLSEVVREVSEMERSGKAGRGGLEDFGRAFQRVIEAGRNATMQIDGMELGEKSLDLRRRADETRAESMKALARLTEIKSERLCLTFNTPSANFTSTDAIQYLEGFNDPGAALEDKVTLMQRMTFKNPIQQEIESFAAAESEYNKKSDERSSLEQQMQDRRRVLVQVENDAMAAVQAEEHARKMLEDAQRQVAESQRVVTEAQKSLRDLDLTARRADQELSKASIMLRRKQDIVRRELKRRADKIEGSVFDRSDDGRVRLNPGFEKSSMNYMGFEGQNLVTIEALRRDERRVESDFLRLVEKASRLVSRSERLRIRSEELMGKQQQQQLGSLNNSGSAFSTSSEMVGAVETWNKADKRNSSYLDSL